jgi:hypothetical protein
MTRSTPDPPLAFVENQSHLHESLKQIGSAHAIALELTKQNGILQDRIRELEAQLRRSEQRAHEIEHCGPSVVQIQRQLGVFHYMRSIDPDSVRVTWSSFRDIAGCMHCSNIFSLDGGTFTWVSEAKEESWISFELIGKKLRLSSYSLRSYLNGSEEYLQIWLLMGSRDGQNWEQIDLRRDEKLFVNNRDIHSFDLHPMTVPYSHFRFVQHGANYKGRHYFCLSFVELFGELHDD